ncbi:6124_t:CDS:1, partial [Acaulospora morrowiae]
LEPSKIEDITPPIQHNQSIDDYFNQIKTYATELGVSLDNQDLKVKFFNGLSPENKKDMIRFGFKEPLKKIVEHLNRISAGPTDMQKF